MTDGQLRIAAEMRAKTWGVSGAAMNRVYDMLRGMDDDHLRRMWDAADPYEPAGALLRHQIAVTIERRRDGRWPQTAPATA